MLRKLDPGDVMTVTRNRQAHRGRQGTVPIFGGTVGRHRHQHRALNAGGTLGLGAAPAFGGAGDRAQPFCQGKRSAHGLSLRHPRCRIIGRLGASGWSIAFSPPHNPDKSV